MTAAEVHRRLTAGESSEVMGFRLLPLTLGHARVMDMLGCIQLRDPGDVALAVLICSRPWNEALPWLRSWLFPLRMFVWRLYLRHWDPIVEMRNLVAYFRRHTELPEMLSNEERSGGPSPIPAHQLIRTQLLARLGYSPDEIDGTPYLQALWDVHTLSVIEGRARMLDMTAADIEEREKAIDWDAVERRAKEVFACST